LLKADNHDWTMTKTTMALFSNFKIQIGEKIVSYSWTMTEKTMDK